MQSCRHPRTASRATSSFGVQPPVDQFPRVSTPGPWYLIRFQKSKCVCTALLVKNTTGGTAPGPGSSKALNQVRTERGAYPMQHLPQLLYFVFIQGIAPPNESSGCFRPRRRWCHWSSKSSSSWFSPAFSTLAGCGPGTALFRRRNPNGRSRHHPRCITRPNPGYRETLTPSIA
jgi:hypothetical protein